MRALALALALVLAGVVAACGPGDDPGALRVVGSGDVVVESRSLDSFTEVVFASEGEVEIRQGASPSLEIVTSGDLHRYIESEVAGGVLTIRTRSGIDLDPSAPVRFIVGLADIARIEIAGAGDVFVERLESVDVVLEVTGAGDIGVAELDADTVQVSVSGAGDVTLAGTARRLIVGWRGAGSLDSSGLGSMTAEVTIDGVAQLDLGPTDRLGVSGGGSGRVDYAGDPVIVDSSGTSITVRRSGP